jgi:methionine synthase II (cobalamin-independent)
MSERTRTPVWTPGAATGIGSLPGTDPVEAMRIVLGELGDLPHLPELPARGFGAQMIGRAASLLVDMPVEVTSTGWCLTEHVSRDLRRALDFLNQDLDALVEQGDVVSGAFKIQVAGPWTMASSIELRSGHKVLSDFGARRDLADSLSVGIAAHVADVVRRLPPSTRIVLQVDEPSLPAVLAGRVPTPSGLSMVNAVEESTVIETLQALFAASGAHATAIHCCSSDAPLRTMSRVGTDSIGIETVTPNAARLDAIGEFVDSGRSVWLGVLPGTDTAGLTIKSVVESVSALWGQLGFPTNQLPDSVVLTPVCGFAGASPAYVRHALKIITEAGHALREIG